ncbi:MAG: hypothetical protein K8S18_09935 [Desulfobacula sp.]|nr:hypothetical protein [Desulfobacula sp.]
MPQTFFPIFPDDSVYLNSDIAIKTINEIVFYFNGLMPIYQHHKDDYRSFRYISSQLYVLGNVKQVEIVKTFNVSKESVKRWVKVYKEEGASGFFKTRKSKKKGKVLTKEILQKIQSLLNMGQSVSIIGKSLDIKPDTIRKAILYGRLTKPVVSDENENSPSAKSKTQSQRNQEDSKALAGMACTNTKGRLDAIVKKK